jgi:hypothetical protein
MCYINVTYLANVYRILLPGISKQEGEYWSAARCIFLNNMMYLLRFSGVTANQRFLS